MKIFEDISHSEASLSICLELDSAGSEYKTFETQMEATDPFVRGINFAETLKIPTIPAYNK